MSSNKFIKHSKISSGQYTVSINFRGISNSEKFQELEIIIKEISNNCNDDIGDDLLLARQREAQERKKLISSGQASEKYCLGLTTFYSFSTPVRGRFRDVQGAEKLFRPILKKIIIPFELAKKLPAPSFVRCLKTRPSLFYTGKLIDS